MTCRLLDLPDEILDHVVNVGSCIVKHPKNTLLSWPYPEHSSTHLQALALTCRKLYVLCLPYLWRDKEFILPEASTQPSTTQSLIATDILREPSALKQHDDQPLGWYVRSLSRDLSTSPHYNLANSALMACLVANLRALRMDFHPKPRCEHYGLAYFAQHCAMLTELYLDNCRDTFDDFGSLVIHDRALESLTLVSCSIKPGTLLAILHKSRSKLQSLHLQSVWLEPVNAMDDTNTPRRNSLTSAYLASRAVTMIPAFLYTSLLANLPALTRIALSDSLSLDLVQCLVNGSPHLERVTLSLHEQQPTRIITALNALASLSRLAFMSLAFRYQTNDAQQRLPCALPAAQVHQWLAKLPASLAFLHLSAQQLLLHPDTVAAIVQAPRLAHVLLHHVALPPPPLTNSLSSSSIASSSSISSPWQPNAVQTEVPNDLARAYDHESINAQSSLAAWQFLPSWPQLQPFVVPCAQVQQRGISAFDPINQICVVKGFDNWNAQ
ncbi:hypothetical protein BC940DRAFT_301035 [Gongronella butleri]|nr:hypothetical protein BC940DRAFT_301035 [Gongronella butleri]